MRKLLFLICIVNSFGSSAQYKVKEYTTKTIVNQYSIYLRSVAGEMFVNGNSTNIIDINLPSNTKEWYYSFYTSPGESGTKNLNLALQLGTLLADPTGLTASATSSIKIPAGTNAVDIYLTDYDNRNLFSSESAFNYYTEGTVKNAKSALVQVNSLNKGKYYLCISNPSSWDGVNATIEVTAILENEVYVDEWTSENIDNIKTNCLRNFNTNGVGKNEVCDCLRDKITTENKPSTWFNKSKSSQNSTLESTLDKCFSETGNTALKQAELDYLEAERKRLEDLNARWSVIQEKISSAQSSAEFKDYDDAYATMKEALELLEDDKEIKKRFTPSQLSLYHNSVAWYALLNNDLDNCSVYLKSGLRYDFKSMYIWGNKGLMHLVKGEYNDAKDALTKYKRREKLPNGKKWVEVIAEDLELLESLGMVNDDFDKIRKELNIDQSLRDQFKNKFKKKEK